ncbi:hypothetical protein CKY10_10445 [Photorhabdus sp. HUG-39]|nr:hypothetical protein CKY10_10445 [Photorhabdus sp. HUG-39]
MIIKSSSNSKKKFHFLNLQKVDFVRKCYKFNKRLSYCKYNEECNPIPKRISPRYIKKLAFTDFPHPALIKNQLQILRLLFLQQLFEENSDIVIILIFP